MVEVGAPVASRTAPVVEKASFVEWPAVLAVAVLRTKGRGGHEAWRASHLADATASRSGQIGTPAIQRMTSRSMAPS